MKKSEITEKTLLGEEKGSATCQTGVLYNRCGMLSLWGGALKTDKNGQKRTKTDIGAPQNT
ncbi:MAG: hypothetical protein IKC65_10035, partial [Lentisphaeria bacterium]|nr:hypothetical protein [Lentisphaeria bacterium]